MNKFIDLHVHSTASDGTYTPAELIKLAHETGLLAIALTDHDSVDGIEEARRAADNFQIELIPGTEFSTEYQGKEIHVVGLYIDHKNKALADQLREFRDCRDNRNEKMTLRLQEEGFSIPYEDLLKTFPDCVLTRAHIARYLLDTKQVSSISEVFDKYIGDGCKCYVDRPKVTPMDAVSLIHQAGGTAFLAHPCLYKMKRHELTAMLDELADAGLDGIEAVYSCNQGSDEKDFKSLASNYHMIISGGSDFHGTNKPYIKLGTGKGNLKIPYSILEDIKTYRQQKN